MKKEGEDLFFTKSKPHNLLNKRGQVWIETAMYILIATVIIGLVISFVGPKISEMQDKAILENSATMLKQLEDEIASTIRDGPGSRRKFELPLRKGALTIDSINNKIIFEMEGRYAYSEPGMFITQGSLLIYTRQTGNLKIVNMTSSYPNYDIAYEGENKTKMISQSPNPYTLFIENKGGSTPVVNFEIR